MDSDESSSLRSSSTETTNADERLSLTEFQQFSKPPTGNCSKLFVGPFTSYWYCYLKVTFSLHRS